MLFSSASAVATFHRHGHLNRSLAFKLTMPTLLGVPIGALLAVYLPSSTFEGLFGVLFLVMAVLLLRNPKGMIKANETNERPTWMMLPVFFGIGIYVGFIQAGMGILVLLAMSVFNTGDLVASNAVKNLIGFLVTLAATTVFMIYGLIEWLPGLTMATGNVIGGFVGAKLAIRKGNRLIFGFLVVVMIATGIKLIVTSIL